MKYFHCVFAEISKVCTKLNRPGKGRQKVRTHYTRRHLNEEVKTYFVHEKYKLIQFIERFLLLILETSKNVN